MSKTSTVSFISGVAISFGTGIRDRQLDQWHIVGTVERQPFYFHCMRIGGSHWETEVGKEISQMLKNRVRAALRREEKNGKMNWLRYFDIDLNALHMQSSSADTDARNEAIEYLYSKVWREETLGMKEEDFIILNVPKADVKKARLAGAQWISKKKQFGMHKSLNPSDFVEWLPEPELELNS